MRCTQIACSSLLQIYKEFIPGHGSKRATSHNGFSPTKALLDPPAQQIRIFLINLAVDRVAVSLKRLEFAFHVGKHALLLLEFHLLADFAAS